MEIQKCRTTSSTGVAEPRGASTGFYRVEAQHHTSIGTSGGAVVKAKSPPGVSAGSYRAEHPSASTTHQCTTSDTSTLAITSASTISYSDTHKVHAGQGSCGGSSGLDFNGLGSWSEKRKWGDEVKEEKRRRGSLKGDHVGSKSETSGERVETCETLGSAQLRESGSKGGLRGLFGEGSWGSGSASSYYSKPPASSVYTASYAAVGSSADNRTSGHLVHIQQFTKGGSSQSINLPRCSNERKLPEDEELEGGEVQKRRQRQPQSTVRSSLEERGGSSGLRVQTTFLQLERVQPLPQAGAKAAPGKRGPTIQGQELTLDVQTTRAPEGVATTRPHLIICMAWN